MAGVLGATLRSSHQAQSCRVGASPGLRQEQMFSPSLFRNCCSRPGRLTRCWSSLGAGIGGGPMGFGGCRVALVW